eukprot:TRINITY_DN8371_c0_g1_i5.p7 TRINITY_DN8371_c0_g1~~TRINITY_DN8371_c0_g1_i5.p7  ORF type:complete len:110 (+),score=0.56 TRINITY_DN8371_c0_g1_i5:577-906(+)
MPSHPKSGHCSPQSLQPQQTQKSNIINNNKFILKQQTRKNKPTLFPLQQFKLKLKPQLAKQLQQIQQQSFRASVDSISQNATKFNLGQLFYLNAPQLKVTIFHKIIQFL